MLNTQLRKARKAAGKTQKEVAAFLGITESTYCGYETGKRQPDALKISKIASFLNVTGDWILETGQQVTDKNQEHLNALYLQLNREGQEKLIDYADDLISSGKYIKSDSADVVHQAK